ncbi:PaaI family thioesterase [Streptomyces sp. NPDC057199]|uniref:PaaI family thioesterase n=1 Tax=Streptomyces sp. NPDC057199 TaxID=3346047 RepID=UPI003627E079
MNDVEARRRAAGRLAEVLREVNAMAVLTEVSVDGLDAATAVARTLADRLGAVTRPPDRLASVDDLTTGVRMFNPVSGPASPLAPPMRFALTAECTVGEVTLGPAHEGHVGFAHGGVIALLLDEALGTAASQRVWPSVTSHLHTRYRRPVPIGVPLTVSARITAAEGSRMTVRGQVSTAAAPERLLAEGEGLFIELSDERAAQLLGSALRRVRGRPVTVDSTATDE